MALSLRSLPILLAALFLRTEASTFIHSRAAYYTTFFSGMSLKKLPSLTNSATFQQPPPHPSPGNHIPLGHFLNNPSRITDPPTPYKT
ncbi:hypothetical protein V6N13_073373 [Hibiscus sabdariffa]|uniref:Uncharacterized protein n=1 Tax=Hibiscus sabdariffa TaxID=183260 RepID=A0ABR2BFP1_9ROSI